MLCPCGGKTIVRDTVVFESNRYRRRKCIACGGNVYTIVGELRIRQWPEGAWRVKEASKKRTRTPPTF